MIHFVTTHDHGYTVRHLINRLGRGVCRHWTYEETFSTRWLPQGSWVFTDHERLSAYELALGARVAHHLEQGGARVLNHPARVARRFDLLTRLRAAGINQFAAWRAEAAPRPQRFPVFIRNEYDHETHDARLIQSQAALDAALSQMRHDGFSLVGKLVIEYAGEEVSPGVWQRLQTYRIGDTIIAHTNVVDFKWVVRDCEDKERLQNHPCFDRFIEREQEFITQNLYTDVLRQAFDLAGIEYGRADFALVDNRPQVYEINTNPTHADHVWLFRDIHPRRAEIQRYSEDTVEAALRAIDIGGSGLIRIRDAMLKRQRPPHRPWIQRLLRRPAVQRPLPRP